MCYCQTVPTNSYAPTVRTLLRVMLEGRRGFSAAPVRGGDRGRRGGSTTILRPAEESQGCRVEETDRQGAYFVITCVNHVKRDLQSRSRDGRSSAGSQVMLKSLPGFADAGACPKIIRPAQRHQRLSENSQSRLIPCRKKMHSDLLMNSIFMGSQAVSPSIFGRRIMRCIRSAASRPNMMHSPGSRRRDALSPPSSTRSHRAHSPTQPQ